MTAIGLKIDGRLVDYCANWDSALDAAGHLIQQAMQNRAGTESDATETKPVRIVFEVVTCVVKEK